MPTIRKEIEIRKKVKLFTVESTRQKGHKAINKGKTTRLINTSTALLGKNAQDVT